MQKQQLFFQKLAKQIQTRFAKQSIVLVGGCFDLLHYGHLQFLKAAKQQGDALIIALDSDEFIRKTKRLIPVHTQAQRQAILESLSFVDFVIPIPYLDNYKDYLALVKAVKPAIIAITEKDPQAANKKKQAQLVQAKVIEVVPLYAKYSTSAILKKLDSV